MGAWSVMQAVAGRARGADLAGPWSLAAALDGADNRDVIDHARAPVPLQGSRSESRLEALDRSECLRLLESHHIGRLAVVADGQPLIFPVNYAMAGGHVVFRSDPGTKLHAAVDQRVAFEIDGIDGMYHRGWSVLVVGVAHEEHNEAHLRELACLPFSTWVGGPKSHWLRIAGGAIAGRTITRDGGRD